MTERATTTRYEVESELNPVYIGNGHMADYYGLYRVVKYVGDVRTVLREYTGGYGRENAYRHAARLNTASEEA